MSTPQRQVSLGLPPGPTAHGPLTITDFVVYQGASGDLASIHHDTDVARAAGYEQPFAPGMYPAGLLASWATAWLGAENLRRYRVRFAQMVWPGDTLVCTGRVTGTAEQDGATLVELELEASSGEQIVLHGSATFVIPASELI